MLADHVRDTAASVVLVEHGHVPGHTLRQSLPKARAIAVAFHDDEVVTVCALMADNPAHFTSIFRDSRYASPTTALVLGSAATGERHKGRALKTTLILEIINHAKGVLFARIRLGNRIEERNLQRCGCARKGAIWCGGDPHDIALWVRM